MRVVLNGTGRNLLGAPRLLKVKLTATQSLDGGQVKTISTQTVIIKIKPHEHH